MKYKEMLSYIDNKPDTIGFLRYTSHRVFSSHGVDSKGLSYQELITKITCMYHEKRISNKVASDLILIAYNANPLI